MIIRLICGVILCGFLFCGSAIPGQAYSHQERASDVRDSNGLVPAPDASLTMETASTNCANPAPMPPPSAKAGGNSDRGQVGVGVRLSLLGAGAEAAVSLSKHFDVRGGFNYFSYGRDFTHDGITYHGQLDLRSGEAHFDWSPLGQWFHVSPGLLIYNGNKLSGNANVPGNSTFTLGGTTYLSDPSNPIGGNGKVEFRKVSPTAMIGFGSLVPHHRHFSVTSDLGVVFQGQARTTLGFTGNACAPNGTNCVNAATDPNVQANVLAEQVKINNKLSSFKYYPVLSFGFGYRF
jgi:hypothetical protein